MSVREIVKMWPTLLIGSILVIVIVPVLDVGMDSIRGTYDDRNPVVLANGTLVAAKEDWIEVAIVGDKKRACIYVALAAYATDKDGMMRDTFVSRVDMPTTNSTRPVGAQSFGVWRIWPAMGAVRVQIWSTHQCEGRLVRTLMADVEIPR